MDLILAIILIIAIIGNIFMFLWLKETHRILLASANELEEKKKMYDPAHHTVWGNVLRHDPSSNPWIPPK